MLKKLVKYDLIWINKFMLIYFSITFILCILARIFTLFNESFVGNIIYLILRGCAISAFVSVLINCVIRIWVRFSRNLYKDESYLTHTLPVSKCTLYNSKMISFILSILLSVIVIVLGFVIAFLDKDIINYIKMMFESSDGIFIFISILVISIMEFIYMMNCGLMGILIGHRSNNNRTVKSVFIGIVLYFMLQTILLVIMYFIGLINTNMNELFTSNISTLPNISSIKEIMVIAIIIYTIFNICMYFIGKILFNKGVNVE